MLRVVSNLSDCSFTDSPTGRKFTASRYVQFRLRERRDTHGLGCPSASGAATLWRSSVSAAALSAFDRVALAFYCATELPLVVAITTIAIDAGKMRPSTAAGLVGAAMLSTLIFPFIGMALQKRAMAEQDEDPLTPPMIEPLPGA